MFKSLPSEMCEICPKYCFFPVGENKESSFLLPSPVLWIRITLMRIRMRIRILIFLFDADPDPTFNTDPDQDPSFKNRLKPLKKC